jgi:hypothetical protein
MPTAAQIAKLAQKVKRGDQPPWLPRAPQVMLHYGNVVDADPYSGTVDFEFNDPTGLVYPRMQVLLPYTEASQPQQGHVVVTQHYGTDIFVLGRHLITPNFVQM